MFLDCEQKACKYWKKNGPMQMMYLVEVNPELHSVNQWMRWRGLDVRYSLNCNHAEGTTNYGYFADGSCMAWHLEVLIPQSFIAYTTEADRVLHMHTYNVRSWCNLNIIIYHFWS